VLIITGIIVIVAIWYTQRLEYEYNYAKMQTGGIPSYELKKEIISRFGFASDVLYLRTVGIDSADLYKSNLQIDKKH